MSQISFDDFPEQRPDTGTATYESVRWRKEKDEKNKAGSLSEKSGSPLLCPFLFVGRRWWIQSCQPPVSHGDSQESPEAENVWLTDSKSHCCSASDSDWRQWVSGRALLKSLPPTGSLRGHYQWLSEARHDVNSDLQSHSTEDAVGEPQISCKRI